MRASRDDIGVPENHLERSRSHTVRKMQQGTEAGQEGSWQLRPEERVQPSRGSPSEDLAKNVDRLGGGLSSQPE